MELLQTLTSITAHHGTETGIATGSFLHGKVRVVPGDTPGYEPLNRSNALAAVPDVRPHDVRLFIRRDEIQNAKDSRLALVHDSPGNHGYNSGLPDT